MESRRRPPDLPADRALDSYRENAEAFCEELDREYYLHLSGRKQSLEIEAIYQRRADLFTRDAVERLREEWDRSGDGDGRRRARHLLLFGFDGYLGQATKEEAARLAELEASLEVEVDGSRIPYRGVATEQANEPDPERRAALETARNEVLAQELNPHHLVALERVHALAGELGWASYGEAYAELRGIDLAELGRQAGEFLDATEESYARIADPELERAGIPPLGELRRSDMPRFFRAPALDGLFPGERLVGAFADTVAGLGIDLAGQRNVHLDTEPRPTKSPRAFCATPRVPEEVYLVISPVGGRDDFEALFHEGGHVEHYAHVDAGISFEDRRLGDNSVTESFAFLFEHLTEDREWLAARLGVAEPEPVLDHARAVKLVMLRRYAAKIAYELELHSGGPLDAMQSRYVELLSGSTRVAWPGESWLSDVDPGFYVACYLRAWALETTWRRALRNRFGERWFESREAGEWLRGLWRLGQRLDATELLADALGEPLDFGSLALEFTRR
jgi:hypothetical protein